MEEINMLSFDPLPPALEQGIHPLECLAKAPIPSLNAPYARTRALLLFAMEHASFAFSQHALPFLSSQDARRDLCLVSQIDGRQEISLLQCRPQDETELERAILFSMLALELSAVLGQRLPNGDLRRAMHFVLPEFLDEIYRLSNLMMLLEGRPAHELLGGYVEIMPGRPLLSCHRHPYDLIRRPQSGASILESMAPLMLAGVCQSQRLCFLSSAANVKDSLARALYLELAQLSCQHQAHFESLIPHQSPLQRFFLWQYTEGYLYDSCAQEEENAALRQMYLEERDHELAHIRKAADLYAREMGESLPIPEFPDRLRLGPNKGFVRDILQQVGITALREDYVPVGQLPQGADFFRYQQKICPQAENVPSHQVISRLIEKTGEDYRYEIALHPIEALRNRQKDNTQVGR